MNQVEREFLTVGGAAKILRLSTDRVRNLERTGVLPAIRAGQVRLFDRAAVERLAAARAQRQEQRGQ